MIIVNSFFNEEGDLILFDTPGLDLYIFTHSWTCWVGNQLNFRNILSRGYKIQYLLRYLAFCNVLHIWLCPGPPY